MNKFTRMVRLAACLALLADTALAQQALQVPSGQPLTLDEVLIDDSEGETWVRFRFLAPRIGEDSDPVTFEKSSADMDYLCEYLVLSYLAEYALDPARVVLSLSDRSVPFGTANPEATQFFEAYRPEGDRCIWEGF